jgi:hypothetical protein
LIARTLSDRASTLEATLAESNWDPPPEVTGMVDDLAAYGANIDDNLESIAVTRQFLKTLSLQQDFGRLSRVLVYSGLAAFATVVSLTLVYRTGSVPSSSTSSDRRRSLNGPPLSGRSSRRDDGNRY